VGTKKINSGKGGKGGDMIYFVTSNNGKFAEARAIFEDLVQRVSGWMTI
jgi:hypothetical protein